jgi:hypothetical protein
MKTTLLNFFLIMALSCCNNSTTNKSLIKEAEIYTKDATIEANAWLSNFNKMGYKIFLNHHFPPPFDKIIDDSIKNSLQHSSAIDSIKRSEIKNWITRMEQKYGTVRDRNFKGIHMILKGKLFTYVPGKMSGFQETNPERLGLSEVRQLYIKNVEGTYAILMYESRPSKTERAEEKIMLWLDEHGKWTFLTYSIDDI